MTITDYTLSRTADGRWLCVDFARGIHVTWENQKFNETQEYTCNDHKVGPTVLARNARLMTEWLMAYHIEKICIAPIEDIERCTRRRIGAEVRHLRTEYGMSQRQLGDIAGLAKNHIQRIEDGRYNVTMDTLAAVSFALGCDITLKKQD